VIRLFSQHSKVFLSIFPLKNVDKLTELQQVCIQLDFYESSSIAIRLLNMIHGGYADMLNKYSAAAVSNWLPSSKIRIVCV